MKNRKRIIPLVLLLALILLGCASSGAKWIGKDAALQAALTDAELTENEVRDVEIEFERRFRSAWYEVDFESGWTEYEYRVDARSGQILSVRIDH